MQKTTNSKPCNHRLRKNNHKTLALKGVLFRDGCSALAPLLTIADLSTRSDNSSRPDMRKLVVLLRALIDATYNQRQRLSKLRLRVLKSAAAPDPQFSQARKAVTSPFTHPVQDIHVTLVATDE